MNKKLIERAIVAYHFADDDECDLLTPVIEAVLRVAIEACVEICSDEANWNIQQEQSAEGQLATFYSRRVLSCQKLANQIRVLLD